MRNLAESGMTMLVVTHKMCIAEDVADNVVFSDKGKIVAPGAKLCGLQHSRIRVFRQRVLRRTV